MNSSQRQIMRGARHSIGVFAVIFIVLFAIIGGCTAYKNGYQDSERHVVTKVLSKERVCNSSNDGQSSCSYLVFTEADTFQVTDSFFLGRFDSSNVYGKIIEGHTYDFTVVGWRNGFLSWYPNIKDMREL